MHFNVREGGGSPAGIEPAAAGLTMILPHRPAWERARDRGGKSGALPLSYRLPPFSHASAVGGRRKRSALAMVVAFAPCPGLHAPPARRITPASSPSHLRVGVGPVGKRNRPARGCSARAGRCSRSRRIGHVAPRVRLHPRPPALDLLVVPAQSDSRIRGDAHGAPRRHQAHVSPEPTDARLPLRARRRAGVLELPGRYGESGLRHRASAVMSFKGDQGARNEKSRLRCLAVHSCCGAAVLPRQAGRTTVRTSGRDSQGRQL